MTAAVTVGVKNILQFMKIAKCLAILNEHHTVFWGKAIILFTNPSGQKKNVQGCNPFHVSQSFKSVLLLNPRAVIAAQQFAGKAQFC